MKIAVTSQNRKAVTSHAGRCRRFWVYTVSKGQVTHKQLLEFPKEQSLHDSASHASGAAAAHPIYAMDVLLVGGMGPGLASRLAEHGVKVLITKESDPDAAVATYLEGLDIDL